MEIPLRPSTKITLLNFVSSRRRLHVTNYRCENQITLVVCLINNQTLIFFSRPSTSTAVRFPENYDATSIFHIRNASNVLGLPNFAFPTTTTYLHHRAVVNLFFNRTNRTYRHKLPSDSRTLKLFAEDLNLSRSPVCVAAIKHLTYPRGSFPGRIICILIRQLATSHYPILSCTPRGL